METTTIPETKVNKLQIRTELLKFLNSAKSTDKLRYGLQFYHVQDGFIFCTDGRRAHRIKLSEVNPIGGQLENGVYTLCCIEKTKLFSVCLINKEEDTSPNLKGVWPVTTNQIREKSFSFDNDLMTLSSRLLYIFSITNRAINIEYLKDLHYEKKFSIWNIAFEKGFDKDEGKPLVFYSENANVQALIFPFKYNKD